MPYKIRNRKCRQSSGKSGNYAVVKIKSSGEEQTSCHETEEAAKSSIRARYANEGIMKIKKKTLTRIIQEVFAAEKLKQDLSTPILIDDLQFVDEEGYGAMMFPGAGFSYSVREDKFEEEKAKLKKRYGDDVRISVPDPRYPKSKKLHSNKFAKAQSRENQNFARNQAMMKKRLGRNPGLGT